MVPGWIYSISSLSHKRICYTLKANKQNSQEEELILQVQNFPNCVTDTFETGKHRGMAQYFTRVMKKYLKWLLHTLLLSAIHSKMINFYVKSYSHV